MRSATWGRNGKRLSARTVGGMVVATAVGVSVLGSTAAFADSGTTSVVGSTVSAVTNVATSTVSTAANAVSATTATPAVVGPATQTPSTNAPLSLADVESSIGAPASWSAGYTGQGVDVAVLDTGVTQVPGLSGPNKVVYGPDLSFDSQNPNTAYVDGFGHGTAMAGLIAGNDGTTGGFSGVAPNSRIVSVKVGASNGAVDVSQIIAGIDWVTQHAQSNGLNIRVLSLSLGTDSLQPYVLDPLAHAAEQAWKQGIVVVAAVGNQGANATTVSDPATDPYLLAVGAADSNGTIDQSDDVAASFSSVGTWSRHADLVAPGAYITSLRDPGSYLDTNYPAAQINGRFFRGSGTSQATALTAGAVADLLSEYPTLSPDQVKAMLTNSAVNIATRSPLAVGAGELNLAAAESSRVPRPYTAAQYFTNSNGLGSLEASRGDAHISIGGQTLTGNQDIFGNYWNSRAIARAEENGYAWYGGQFNSATWSGFGWSSATWSSATWSSATWSSATWSSATWSSATWSSATWSSATWSSATWSSATWSGSTWA